MVFYLPEPKAREDKPDFKHIPDALLQDIEVTIKSKVVKSQIAWGGYSPTFSVVVETENQQQFFIKGSYPDHTAHGYKILQQEINVYQNLSSLRRITPEFIGYVSYGTEDDWHLGIWRAIDGAHIKKALNSVDIDAIFEQLSEFYKSTDIHQAEKDLNQATETNFVQDIISGQNGWLKFKGNLDRQNNFAQMFKNPDKGRHWLKIHLEDLVRNSLNQDLDHKNAVINFDMRLDNIIFDLKNRPFIIDWPDACIGHVGYDVINLCINISVESGQNAAENLEKFSKISGIKIPEKDVISILSKLSGYYALQAYRPNPIKLPRLRWMQKAMLWGSINWLVEINGHKNLPELRKFS